MTETKPLLLKPTELNVACELTPSDRGAISVIGICGLDLGARLASFFKAANGRPLPKQLKQKPIYGLWNQEDVILCFQRSDYAEVHCHGSVFARRRIIDDLKSLGFAIQSWKELASANESTAEQAIRQLANCSTLKTAAIMTWQSEGALDRAFSEIDSLQQTGDTDGALKKIQDLLGLSTLGGHLAQPWNVAIVGAPNVGKSSLINRIVGYNRSIVFDQPGTTRDRVTVETAIEGWPIRLIDTAGIHDSLDSIEQAGVALSKQAIEDADLVLLVIDGSDRGQDSIANSAKNQLVVLNKCDLLDDCPETETYLEPIRVSALTGHGIDSLLRSISESLVPNPPALNQAVPFLDEHRRHLERLRSGIQDC